MKSLKTLTPLGSALAACGLLAVSLPVFAQTNVQKSDEVIVTAQKVAQPASKTALSLTVVSGDDLKSVGALDARALTNLAPNVNIAQEAGRMQINIRGVMSVDSTERGDPSAAFHVDGVVIGRPEAQLGAFLDVERIEVLRGPQGTLYGRNATAGAINVISNKPGKKFEGSVAVDVGDYGAIRTNGALNVPVNDAFALRAAFLTSKRDTYFKAGPLMQPNRQLPDQDDYAARVHGLLTFSPDTSLLLTVEKSHQGDSGGELPVPLASFYSGSGTGTTSIGTAISTANDVLNPVRIDLGRSTQFTINVPTSRFGDRHRDNNSEMYRGEFKTSLGVADLVYDIGYLKTDQDFTLGGTFNGGPFWGLIKTDNTQFTNELRLSSNDTAGKFKWVAGAFTLDEKISRNVNYVTQFATFDFALRFLPKAKNTSTAVFGQTSYALTDTLRLITGLRNTRDKKSAQDPLGGFNPDAVFNGAIAPPAYQGQRTAGPGAYNRSVSFTKTTWKVGLDWDVSKDTFAYGSVSKGYKTGTFNGDNVSPDVKPEDLLAYELGVKTKLLDNKLQLNTSVFFYDYKNLQVTSNVCLSLTDCRSLTKNADKAAIKGLEVEGVLRPTDYDRLTMGLSYNKSEYKGYRPVDVVTNIGTASAPNFVPQVINFDGQPLDRAPKATLRVGYQHTVDLANGGSVVGAFSTRFSTSYLISAYGSNYAVRYTQPHYNQSDAQLTYYSPDSRFYVQGYIKNIEDTIIVVSKEPGAVELNEPRTFGVRVGYTFW